MRRHLLVLLTALLAATFVAGCTRSFYRLWADRETYPIEVERYVLPEYDIGRIDITPAPESRLYDPTNPDHPPRPPDDPAAAVFMARPNGMKGARIWNRDGVSDRIEPEGWEEALKPDEKGVVKLDQDRSVEVALLNSREYQTALEAVYLAALNLTFDRFEFDLHWFGRNGTLFTHNGSGSFPTETNTLTSLTDVGFTRSLAAGGQLAVDFANSVAYEFVGRTTQVKSNIVLTFMQPLLRNAGRYVRLETLTQDERNVLYAVRDFGHFRKQFWANVAIQSGGYQDLLLLLQTLRNNEANLKRQEENYRLYKELFRAGRASVVEVDQIFQGLQQSRQAVIDARVNFERSLDAFKLRLGVPPRLPVELDDALLNQFVLVDPGTEKLRAELDSFQQDRLKEIGEPPTVKSLEANFAKLAESSKRVPEALDKAAADLAKWGRRIDRPALPNDDPEQREREQTGYQSAKKLLAEIAADVIKVQSAIEQHRKLVTEQTRKEGWENITLDVKNLLAQLDTGITLQAQARIYLIELPDVDVREPEALAFAKENRFDLQNRKALVTDFWRKIWVAANQLRGDLNIVSLVNVGTDPDHTRPFNFAAEATNVSVGLQFEGPLNRLAERNEYRKSLIFYQVARRAYMGLSDQIEFDIRQDLRQLARLRTSFEISRMQLLSAANQAENSRLKLVGPRDRRTANDTTTLDLLNALSNLLAARNALTANYINFEQQRIQLLLDLESLQLDARGFPDAARTRMPAVPTDLPDPSGEFPPTPSAAPGTPQR
ncbi:MAG: TolC family protein [Planctomycetes bacterium]|nr:TolC family protein [Planctomycetota bacterium]